MNIVVKLAFGVCLAGLLAVGFAYSGVYDVGASNPHSRLVHWFLTTTSQASIERQSRGIEVPDLDDEALIFAGINDFNSMCVACHGAPGKNPEAVGQGLNPAAPDLAKSAANLKPAELFWVTKHGIRMTGMPAWGATHDDQAIWPVVAFLTKLPDLDQSSYQEMLAVAKGRGHHSDSQGHGDNDAMAEKTHDEMEQGHHDEEPPTASAPKAAREHDHSTHDHN